MGACVGVSIQLQTAGSLQGQHTAAAGPSTSLLSLHLCLSVSLTLSLSCLIFAHPSISPCSLRLVLSHLSLPIITFALFAFLFLFFPHSSLMVIIAVAIVLTLFHILVLSLEIIIHHLWCALPANTHTGQMQSLTHAHTCAHTQTTYRELDG